MIHRLDAVQDLARNRTLRLPRLQSMAKVDIDGDQEIDDERQTRRSGKERRFHSCCLEHASDDVIVCAYPELWPDQDG